MEHKVSRYGLEMTSDPDQPFKIRYDPDLDFKIRSVPVFIKMSDPDPDTFFLERSKPFLEI